MPFTGHISGTLSAANFIPNLAQSEDKFEEAVENILAGNDYTSVHTIQYPQGEICGKLKSSSK